MRRGSGGVAVAGQEAFSARLRRAIRQRGMSEAAYARKIGMSATYLSRILNDDAYRPSPETVRRFADGLGEAVEEVASWTDIAATLGLGRDNGSDESPPAEDKAFDPAMIVAWVEAKPDAGFQADMAKQKARRSPASYERLCLSIYRAWTSNADLVLSELESIGQ